MRWYYLIVGILIDERLPLSGNENLRLQIIGLLKQRTEGILNAYNIGRTLDPAPDQLRKHWNSLKVVEAFQRQEQRLQASSFAANHPIFMTFRVTLAHHVANSKNSNWVVDKKKWLTIKEKGKTLYTTLPDPNFMILLRV